MIRLSKDTVDSSNDLGSAVLEDKTLTKKQRQKGR